MYIGLISDTHGVFADDVRKFLEPVDVIWHAGDFGTGECADAIAAFKPLVAVYGNCDGADVRSVYPRYQHFDCEGFNVLMTHIGLRRGTYWAYTPGRLLYDADAEKLIEEFHPDIFVCGHTHIPQVMTDKRHNFLFMNPGACGYTGVQEVPRFALRFKLEKGKILAMQKIELSSKTI